MQENTHNQPGSDEQIRQRILDALRNDPGIDSGKIEVEVKEGTVQLKGHADTEKEKERSESIAASISGVHKVENHLHIELGLVHALSSIAAHIQGDIIDDKEDPEKK